MLKSMFPVSELIKLLVAQDSVALSDLNKHDDLVSVLCINRESLQNCLLFQYGVSLNCDGYSVVYIVPELFKMMPKPVEGMPKPNIHMMEIFTFLYLKTADDLSDYLAELHTLSVLPNIVIIQNLTHYTSQFESEKFHSKTAKLLALIKDAAKYLATKVETIDEAKFVLSVNTFDSEDLLTLLKKNFKNIWYTQEHTNANECTITLARMGSVLNSRLLFEENSHHVKALKIS